MEDNYVCFAILLKEDSYKNLDIYWKDIDSLLEMSYFFLNNIVDEKYKEEYLNLIQNSTEYFQYRQFEDVKEVKELANIIHDFESIIF